MDILPEKHIDYIFRKMILTEAGFTERVMKRIYFRYNFSRFG